MQLVKKRAYWNRVESLLKFMSIESVILSNHLILCCPLLFLPSIFPSIRVFSNELALRIRWPKYWSFSFSISLSNEYSGLTSFRIDWFDLLQSRGLGSTYFFFFFPFDCTTEIMESEFLDQGSNTGPWQWKCRVLTTGPPENSISMGFLYVIFSLLSPLHLKQKSVS